MQFYRQGRRLSSLLSVKNHCKRCRPVYHESDGTLLSRRHPGPQI